MWVANRAKSTLVASQLLFDLADLGSFSMTHSAKLKRSTWFTRIVQLIVVCMSFSISRKLIQFKHTSALFCALFCKASSTLRKAVGKSDPFWEYTLSIATMTMQIVPLSWLFDGLDYWTNAQNLALACVVLL